MELSIIIPLHNEAGRLPGCMARVISWARINLVNTEIILVPNGCVDNTLELCRRYEGQYQVNRLIDVVCIPLNVRGKGAAVRAGMLAASAPLIYMADVDLSSPVKEIFKFWDVLDAGYDGAIGSRALRPEQVKTSLKRRMIGRTFHALVSALVPGVQDTQCGFKMFRASVAKDLFSRAQIDGMAFDVEILYLARQLDYRILEMPVTWTAGKESRVNLMGDSWQMLRDVLKIPGLHGSTLAKEELPA